MNSNFILLNKTQNLNVYFNSFLVNFPKKEIVLKQRIEEVMYDLIEYLFSYNLNTTARAKEKDLKDFLIKLSMLDYYARICFEKRIITKHHFLVIGKRIYEIKKITYGVIKYTNAKNSI